MNVPRPLTGSVRELKPDHSVLLVIGALMVSLLGAFVAGPMMIIAGWLALLVCWVLYAWSVPRLVLWILGLTLALDSPGARPYAYLWHNPLQPLGKLWFSNLTEVVPQSHLKAPPVFLCIGLVAFRAAIGRVGPNWRHATRWPTDALKPPRVVVRSVVLCIGTIVLAEGYGIATGGQVNVTLYQIAGLLTVPLVVLAVTSCADRVFARRLELVIIGVALYRGLVAYAVYLKYYRYAFPRPEYVTSHEDSVLWVVAVIILLAHWLDAPSLRTRRLVLVFGTFLCGAIVVNQRRTAWIELAAAALYLVLTVRSRVRAPMRKLLRYAVPVLAVYTVIGLAAPPTNLFAPVQSIDSVFNSSDDSNRAREIENYNLLVTMRAHPLGTGFGHEYIFAEQDYNLANAGFNLYLYLPHNSVLGLLAFGGPLAFSAYFMLLAVLIAYSARSQQRAREHWLRVMGCWAVAAIMILLIQGWSDMGLLGFAPTMLAAVGAGVAVCAPTARRREREAALEFPAAESSGLVDV